MGIGGDIWMNITNKLDYTMVTYIDAYNENIANIWDPI